MDSACRDEQKSLTLVAIRLRGSRISASAKPNQGICTDLAEAQALAPMPDPYSEMQPTPKN